MKKVLYVILHTQHQPERFNWIVNTWAKNVDYVFISDHDDTNNNIIKVSDNADYDSCEEKQINSVNSLSSNPLEYDFYFLCSNDNFVNTKKMKEFIENCETECVWGELDRAWPGDASLNFTLGGSGVLISKEIMGKIAGNLKWANGTHPSSFPSDVSLAINFRNMDIEMRNCELFHHQLFEKWSELHHPNSEIDYAEMQNHISFHYIKDSKTMNLYHTACGL